MQSWDITAEGWETWSVLLLCFSNHPTAVIHPCLYCCFHQDQSWLFVTLSSFLQSLQVQNETFLQQLVTCLGRCFLILQKVKGFVICLFRHPVSYVTRKIVTLIISPQEEMKEKVWTKAVPLEIALSGRYLQIQCLSPALAT